MTHESSRILPMVLPPWPCLLVANGPTDPPVNITREAARP